MTRLLAIELDVVTSAHLARALDNHRAWCRANGYRWEPTLGELRQLVDTNGPQRPDDGDAPELAHDGSDVALLLDYEHAGRRLSVSARTVRRLVARGELCAVAIGASRLIHVQDLSDYAEKLRGPK